MGCAVWASSAATAVVDGERLLWLNGDIATIVTLASVPIVLLTGNKLLATVLPPGTPDAAGSPRAPPARAEGCRPPAVNAVAALSAASAPWEEAAELPASAAAKVLIESPDSRAPTSCAGGR